MASDQDGFVNDIDRAAVEASLATTIASEQFRNAPQLADFLTYIVSKTLDGEASSIKAYSIAVDALGRSPDFDPQSNALVRVAAGRLRQALSAFASAPEAADLPVLISMEPGSYVPEFRNQRALVRTDDAWLVSETLQATNGVGFTGREPRRLSWIGIIAVCALILAGLALWMSVGPRESPSAVSAAMDQSGKPVLLPQDQRRRPRLKASLVLPDPNYPDWYKVNEMADAMRLVAARFDDFEFLGTDQIDTIEGIDHEDADYHVIVTSYRRGEKVIFFGRLERLPDKTIVWAAQRILGAPRNLDERNTTEMIGRIFSPIASPYGLIHADLARRVQTETDLYCVVLGYQYFHSKSDEKHLAARDCLETLVKNGSQLPAVHSMLTFLYLDEYREGRNPLERDPLRAAVASANQAVNFGPLSARAHQALFATEKVLGNVKEAREAAEEAIALNPFDADILGDYAAWLISIGDLGNGRRLLNRTETMLEARPAWFEFYRFLGAELADETDSASQMARAFDMNRSPLMAIAVAIGAVSIGDQDTSKMALEALRESDPQFYQDPLGQLKKRGFSDAVANKLYQRLIQAGFQPQG